MWKCAHVNQEFTISLFADDTLIIVSVPDKCILELLSFLHAFVSISGNKLNIKMTRILSFNYTPSQDVILRTHLNCKIEYIKYCE